MFSKCYQKMTKIKTRLNAQKQRFYKEFTCPDLLK